MGTLITLIFNIPSAGPIISLPIPVDAVTYSIVWGTDGTTPSTSHTFTNIGLQTVTVTVTSGIVIQFGNGGDIEYDPWIGAEYLQSVTNWNNSLESLSGAFYGCTSLISVPITLPSSITNLSGIFRAASSFNQNISSWNTTNVTDMSYMFHNWTSSTYDPLQSTFNNGDSPGGSSTPLTWNTSNVTSMYGMFYGAVSFNQPFGGAWDVSLVIDTSDMFGGASLFNQDISNWNTSSITNMQRMFTEAILFNNGDPPGVSSNPLTWNTSNVTSMANMFSLSSSFNQPFEGPWNTSNVTEMYGMFDNAIVFNQDISNWNTSLVTNMLGMFQYATSFNQDISGWDITSVEIQTDPIYNAGMNSMFDYSDLSTNNWNNILNGWAAQNVKSGIQLGALGLEHTAAGQNGYNILTRSPNNWVITEGFPICYSRGTMILCKDGYLPIEVLRQGDLVKTYRHGYRKIELIGKGVLRNNPDNWKRCMYLLPAINPGFNDLIVTGGHGILKRTLTSSEIHADSSWFKNNRRYSMIDNMYLQRAAFSKEFIKITTNERYTYYHFSLGNCNRRYGVWANGILSESTFSKDILKLI